MFQVILYYANKICGVITLLAVGVICCAVASSLTLLGLILIHGGYTPWFKVLSGIGILAVVVFLVSLGVGAFCDQLSVDHEED